MRAFITLAASDPVIPIFFGIRYADFGFDYRARQASTRLRAPPPPGHAALSPHWTGHPVGRPDAYLAQAVRNSGNRDVLDIVCRPYRLPPHPLHRPANRMAGRLRPGVDLAQNASELRRS